MDTVRIFNTRFDILELSLLCDPIMYEHTVGDHVSREWINCCATLYKVSVLSRARTDTRPHRILRQQCQSQGSI